MPNENDPQGSQPTSLPPKEGEATPAAKNVAPAAVPGGNSSSNPPEGPEEIVLTSTPTSTPKAPLPPSISGEEDEIEMDLNNDPTANAVSVDLEPAAHAKNPMLNNDGYILPLRSNIEDVRNFMEQWVENFKQENPFDNVPKEYEFMILPWANPQDIIAKMNFEMYWQFRAFQIARIEDLLLKQLKLAKMLDADGNEEYQDARSTLNKLMDAAFAGLGIKTNLTAEEREDYLQQIIAFYKNVFIELKKDGTVNILQKDPDDPTGKNDITLVTITKNPKSNSMMFKIPANIMTGDPAQLDHAISLLVDQATRSREKSWSLMQKISGYEDRPDIALRMYQLIVLNGSQPVISPTTRAAWESKATGDTAEAKEFANAIKLLDRFEAESKDGKLRDKLMEFQIHKLKSVADIKKELNSPSSYSGTTTPSSSKKLN